MTQNRRGNLRTTLKEAAQPWWMKLALLLAVSLGASALAGFRLNVSDSLPLGIYRVVNNISAVERGSIAVVCLPETWSRFASRRRILGSGTCPYGVHGLGKFVVAVEGDVVTITHDKILVGNTLLENGTTIDRDDLGRPIPHHPRGRYTLQAGVVWLYSCHPSAFDSRYFGPVLIETISYIVRPVLIEPSWSQRTCRLPSPASTSRNHFAGF